MLIIFCGFLLSATAVSVDITLPAFSLIAGELPADYATVQLIVPVFIAATGIGQLAMGSLSDRYGRRPVVIAGLSVFAAGSAICLIAPDITTMLTGRAVQGLGASAGPVIGRAILRDRFSGRELARNMALSSMIFAFGPIVAPLAGVGILTLGHWRHIFLAILANSVLLIGFAILRLPETAPRRDPAATRPGVMTANTIAVLGHPQSRFYIMMSGLIMGIMLTVLVSIPRVYAETFGITGTLFALLFAMHGTGIIIGQFANRAIIQAFGTERAMLAGSAVLVVTTLLMAVCHALALLDAYAMSAIMILFATGYLVVLANATALTLDPHGRIAGFVSSFFGFTSQVAGSAVAIILAIVIGGNLIYFVYCMFALTSAVFVLLVMRRKFVAN